MRWIRKSLILKNHRNCLPLGGWEFEADNSPYGIYTTHRWNWMFWIGCLHGACSELARWAVSAIFEKLSLWFNRIFLLFDARKSCVFQIFLLRSIKAYLCPNIIHFDSMDFSGRRPEEVISFFWRSVYIYQSMLSLIFSNSTCVLICKII